MPHTPRVHPASLPLCGLIAGIAAGEWLSTHTELAAGLWTVAACVAFFVLLAASFIGYHRRLNGLTALILFLTLVCVGLIRVGQKEKSLTFTPDVGEQVYEVLITSPPERKPKTMLCRATVQSRSLGDSLAPCAHRRFLVYLSLDSAAMQLARGDRLWIRTRLQRVEDNGIPDEWSYADYLRHHGISGRAYVSAGEWALIAHDGHRSLRQWALDKRAWLSDRYRELGFKGDELAVLLSLTVGDREELSEELIAAYERSGFRHALAISGLHVGLTYAVVLLLFAPLWRRRRRLKPYVLLISVGCLWLFALICGLPVSMVRAVGMCSIHALLSIVRRERATAMDALLATVFILLVVDPFALYDVGLQLSATSVAAILLIQPRLQQLWRPRFRLVRYLWGLITVTVAAQLGSAPLLMHTFARLSVHAVLINPPALVLLSLIMYSAVVLVFLTPFFTLQAAFAPVVNFLIHGLNALLGCLQHLPYAVINDIYLSTAELFLLYLLLALVIGFSRRRSKAYVCLIGLLCLVFVGGRVVQRLGRPAGFGLAFYNVPGRAAVVCFDGSGTPTVACTDAEADLSFYLRSTAPHLRRLAFGAARTVGPAYQDARLYVDENVVLFADKTVYFLGNDKANERVADDVRLDVDYLYITSDCRSMPAEQIERFNAGRVIVDGGLNENRRRSWNAVCSQADIPCISLSKTGGWETFGNEKVKQ